MMPYHIDTIIMHGNHNGVYKALFYHLFDGSHTSTRAKSSQ